MTSPLFIAIEGIDGSGSTTQTSRLVSWLLRLPGSRGCLATKEPWHGGLEDRIRQMIDMNPQPPAWMMASAFIGDRAAHLACEIEPALAAGRHVVSDRYIWSTVAYQLHRIELTRAKQALRELNNAFRKPDLMILLDLPVEKAKIRMTGRRLDGYEKHLDFQREVRARYLEAAQNYEHPVEILDASASVEDIQTSIRELVDELL